HVHTDDLLELLFLEKLSDQLAFATAEIEHALGTARAESRHDGAEALIVEAERRLQHILGLVGWLFVIIGGERLFFLHKSCEGLADKAWLALQITTSDL